MNLHEEASIDRADLAESLHMIELLKGEEKALAEQRKALEGRVREELERNPEPIVDAERGYTAVLREKNKPGEVDLISCAQKPENDEHIVRAASMGLLTARLTQLRGQKGKAACADTLLHYEMPGGVTSELRIERV